MQKRANIWSSVIVPLTPEAVFFFFNVCFLSLAQIGNFCFILKFTESSLSSLSCYWAHLHILKFWLLYISVHPSWNNNTGIRRGQLGKSKGMVDEPATDNRYPQISTTWGASEGVFITTAEKLGLLLIMAGQDVSKWVDSLHGNWGLRTHRNQVRSCRMWASSNREPEKCVYMETVYFRTWSQQPEVLEGVNSGDDSFCSSLLWETGLESWVNSHV